MPGWLFKRNRRRFLRSLLASDRIFLSEFFHARFNAPARVNLHRVLAEADAGR
jgi:predicted metal-dependent HD superfamily phosphohydrolase